MQCTAVCWSALCSLPALTVVEVEVTLPLLRPTRTRCQSTKAAHFLPVKSGGGRHIQNELPGNTEQFVCGKTKSNIQKNSRNDQISLRFTTSLHIKGDCNFIRHKLLQLLSIHYIQ